MTALVEIDKRPAAALSAGAIGRLESSDAPWLAPALRAIAFSRLGRPKEAEENLQLARRWHPGLTPLSTTGAP